MHAAVWLLLMVSGVRAGVAGTEAPEPTVRPEPGMVRRVPVAGSAAPVDTEPEVPPVRPRIELGDARERFQVIAARGERLEAAALKPTNPDHQVVVVVATSRFLPWSNLMFPFFQQLAVTYRDLVVYWVDVDRDDATGPDPSLPVSRQLGFGGRPVLQVRDAKGKITHRGDEAFEHIYSFLFGIRPDEKHALSSGGGHASFKMLQSRGQVIPETDLTVDGGFSALLFCSRQVDLCDLMEGPFQHLADSRRDIFARFVDVDMPGARSPGFGTPISDYYELEGLPSARLYAPDGRIFAEGNRALAILEKHFRSNPPPPEGRGPVPPEKVKGPVAQITEGASLDLKDYLVPGKITLFDFSSPFCGPCKMVAPLLEEAAGKRDDLAVRIVNINRPGAWGIDSGSPVGRQYKVYAVPYFMAFDRDGRSLGKGSTTLLQRIGILDGYGRVR